MRGRIRGLQKGKITRERFDRALESWKGHIQHADTFGLLRYMMDLLYSIGYKPLAQAEAT
jgi:hypothetical protein